MLAGAGSLLGGLARLVFPGHVILAALLVFFGFVLLLHLSLDYFWLDSSLLDFLLDFLLDSFGLALSTQDQEI